MIGLLNRKYEHVACRGNIYAYSREDGMLYMVKKGLEEGKVIYSSLRMQEIPDVVRGILYEHTKRKVFS